ARAGGAAHQARHGQRRPGLAVLRRRGDAALAWREHHLYACVTAGPEGSGHACTPPASCNEGSSRSAMNRFEKLLGLKGEARLRFLDGEFQVITPGDFVRCAVTGEPIMLPDLRYWSVELQEAYASAEISFERHRMVKARGRK